MPSPGNQKKSSKRKTATANAAVASPTNGNMSTSTASKSTTACDFHSFLEMADCKSIAQFCNWASTTSDSENLRLLWIHTLNEGKKWVIKQGRKLGIEEGRKLGIDEGIKKGMNLGHEEGYLVAKEGFERVIKAKEVLEKTNNTVNIDCSPQTNTNTCKMAMQANDNIEQQ